MRNRTKLYYMQVPTSHEECSHCVLQRVLTNKKLHKKENKNLIKRFLNRFSTFLNKLYKSSQINNELTFIICQNNT